MRLPLDLAPVEAKRFDLVGFGENSIDIVVSIPEPPRPDSKMPMSALRGAAGRHRRDGRDGLRSIGLANAVCRARLAAAGTPSGPRRRSSRGGIDVSASRRTDGANRFAVVLVDVPTGSRTVIERREPALAWPPDDVDQREVMTSGRVLLVDSTDVPAATVSARAARQRGIVTVVDVEQPAPGVESLLREHRRHHRGRVLSGCVHREA